MKISAIKYSAIFSCVKSIQSFLFTEKDYSLLLEKSDIKEALTFLFQKNLFIDTSEKKFETIDLVKLENLLNRNLLVTYRKVNHFSSGSSKKFLGIVVKAYMDFYNLKILARNISSKKEPFEHIEDIYFHPPKNLNSSFDGLKMISNLGQIPIFADKTLFKKMFHENLAALQQEQELNIFEDFLLKELFQIILRQSSMLNQADTNIVKKFINHLSDTYNVNALLRIKYILNEDPNEEKQQLLPYGTFDKDLFINKMRNFTLEQSIAYIKDQFHLPAFEINKTNPADMIEDLRIIFEKNFISFCKKSINSNPFSVGPVLGILYLKKNEITNVIMILNAMQQGDKAEVREKIVL